jgi:hypothetical protein
MSIPPAVKRIIGYALLSVSLIALLRWAVLAVQTGSPWDSEPYLWALTIVAFVFGLIWSIPPMEPDEDRAKRYRKRMILIFLAFTIGSALLLLTAHILLTQPPLPSVRTYAPVMIVMSILGYAVCYFFFFRYAEYLTRSFSLSTILFIMGMVLAPVGAVDTYNGFVQKVEVLDSGGDLEKAASDFVSFKNLKLDRSRWLAETYAWHGENKKYHAEFRALIPVVTIPSDTVYRVWIDLFYTKEINDTLKDDEKKKLRDAFDQSCGKRVDAFNADSVVFYDQTFMSGKRVLETNKYPAVKGTVLLAPRYSDLASVQTDSLYTMLGLYVVLCAFFWGTSSGMFDSANEREERRLARKGRLEKASEDKQ